MDVEEYARRREAARAGARQVGIDALLISPGSDLHYLSGYEATPLERLTCLVVPAEGDPWLVVPGLEEAAAKASPVGESGLEIVTWQETDDPYMLVARRLGAAAGPSTSSGTVTGSESGVGSGAPVVAVDNHMWAEKTLRFGAAMPGTEQRLAGEVLGPLRMRKTAAEVEELRRAGAAIDSVHAQMADWLRSGRTEREVARDIAAAIIDAGHVRVDFVIVGSGPNGASPHHEVSDRMIEPGDAVVVDIGGTTATGYCSDETRTYLVGDPSTDSGSRSSPRSRPGSGSGQGAGAGTGAGGGRGSEADEFLALYEVLRQAQQAAVEAVRPGVECQHIDTVAREIITEAGYGKHFIHRTGHGIGLQTHEEPYLVSGNATQLEPGFAFSVEPGIYLPGRYGARIEDIVVCGEDGPELMNHRPRELEVIA